MDWSLYTSVHTPLSWRIQDRPSSWGSFRRDVTLVRCATQQGGHHQGVLPFGTGATGLVLKPFAFDVTQTALLLFSPSPGGRIRALGRSRNARQSDLRQIKRKRIL